MSVEKLKIQIKPFNKKLESWERATNKFFEKTTIIPLYTIPYPISYEIDPK